VDFLHGILTGAYTLDALIEWGGYILLVAIVFTETGLLVGLFLPGDSLLITAGLLAGAGKLDIWWLNVLVIAAAIVGDSTGYAIGVRLGPRIFTRPKSLLFNPKHVARTQRFYEKYGPKTIVIARFVPIIRTFAPVLAGVGRMRYRRFLIYNAAGGIGWVASMTWAGYLLGRTVPNISQHMHVIVIVIIILSVIPIAIEVYRERRKTTARKPVRRR
jgi:membrane-associated protein